MTDSTNLINIIQTIQPNEIYNLAAQSHVAVSFESPEYTANCDALGPLRILEAVRILGLKGKTKIYQASSSELFESQENLKRNNPFILEVPTEAKLLQGITINYRESYGLFACWDSF